MHEPTRYAIYLWIFTVLLAARVLGQLIVATRAPQWLPPMERWQSGLVLYPFLLASQAVVLTVMVWISVDFSRAAGFWVEPRARYLGLAALWWSYLYFAGLVARYSIRMVRRPDQRWFGGTIPIIFHSVVAAFQWTFGMFHRSQM
jgi:hypothetical protein